MKYLVFILSFIIILSCSGDTEKELPLLTQKQMEEKLIQANKNALSIEKKQIEEYVKEKKLNVNTTSTGLKYQIYNDVEGDSIKNGDKVYVSYKVTLLDGTECYNTDSKAEEFLVGKDYVESGLHEAITYLNKGDDAIVIIPSHLGHGLTGDFEKIPVRSTIIYDISVVDVK